MTFQDRQAEEPKQTDVWVKTGAIKAMGIFSPYLDHSLYCLPHVVGRFVVRLVFQVVTVL